MISLSQVNWLIWISGRPNKQAYHSEIESLFSTGDRFRLDREDQEELDELVRRGYLSLELDSCWSEDSVPEVYSVTKSGEEIVSVYTVMEL